jgi:fucose 4-O-acetylase-like acetyltransferase
VHVLLMLTGYSLARFQKARLLAGSIGGMLSTMLLPIVIGYYLILTGVQVAIGPVDPEWFALLGNFDQDINPHGLTPYWFVCLYVQGLVLVALPFSSARVRRWVGEQPLTAGIAALAALAAAGFVLGLPSELGATAVRHPLMGLQLVALGWCVRHAASPTDKWLVAVLSFALAAVFLPAGMSVPVLLALAVAAVLWVESVPLPAALAWLVTYIGKQSMLLYLAHVIVIAVLSRLAWIPDGLMLSLTLLVSLAAAEAVARAMQAMTRAGQGAATRSQDA